MGGGYNFLLEGDNLHSLYLLEKTHKGKIDIIYIDPPYNTANKDFIYSDKYVEQSDGFRHSKWLSFVESRIKISRELLADKGLIFISIDDHEHAQLKLLCDSIFGEDNFLSSFVWQKKSGGGQAKYFYEGHEYLLIYAKDKSKVSGLTEKDLKERKTITIDGKEFQYDDDFIRKTFGKYEKGVERRLHYEDIESVKGINKKKEIDKMLTDKEAILVPDKKTGKNFVAKIIDKDNKRKKLYSILTGFWTSDGNTEIEELGLHFENPKPIKMMKKILDSSDNKSAIILDFFAGSGTTGHAALELNREDGGNRKFILCTNNENNICIDVTYQRIKTVITGNRGDGSKYGNAIPAGLKYYKTDFIKKESKKVTKELNKHVKELIQLEHHIDIDNKVHLMVLSEEELDKIELKWDKLKDTVKSIYRARSVMYTAKQKELFKNVNNIIIPDYYFNNELKEIGENW